MFSFTVRRLIGATAVVCLAASAVVVGSVAVPARTLALPGASESTVVTIEPTRVADTRYNIGLTSKVLANAKAPRKFTVTGPINTYIESTETTVVKQVVPAGATGVFLNVTVVNPSEPGFLAIRPGTATGVPATGGLNFDLDTVLANGILVALPTTGNNAGQIDLYYGSPTADASTDLIFDVVGYTTSSGLINLTKRLETLEASGVQGPAGAKGEPGATGLPGTNGTSCTVEDNNDGTATMTCPDGTNVTSVIVQVVGEDCSRMSFFAYANTGELDFYEWDMSSCDLRKADLRSVQINNVIFGRVNLEGANLTDADLGGADLFGADLNVADLTRANLNRAHLSRALLTYADLTDADLTYASLRDADLTSANLTGANLTEAHLDGADLTDADLTGVTWWNTTCPDLSVNSGPTPCEVLGPQ